MKEMNRFISSENPSASLRVRCRWYFSYCKKNSLLAIINIILDFPGYYRQLIPSSELVTKKVAPNKKRRNTYSASYFAIMKEVTLKQVYGRKP